MSRVLAVCLVALVLASCRSTAATDGDTLVVEGALACPGPQPWQADLTALEALLRAGPIDADADLEHVELWRELDGAMQYHELDLARALERGDTSFNVLVRVGDVLRVRRR